MIYDSAPPDDPIRQGDIFFGLPRVEFSLTEMLEYSDGGVVQKNWDELANQEASTIVAAVRPVLGIVASQDCDVVRARDVTFCEVRSFQDVEKRC